MYVNVNDLKAAGDNVVLKLKKWPSTFLSDSGIIAPNSAINNYDNGRELYLGEVMDSADAHFDKGDFVAIDIFFGVHVPSENRLDKIKIVPATGIVLKSKTELKVMSDIIKMEPGINRLFIKLRKKEAVTAAGIHIPAETLAQDPTAQDVRIADVIKSTVDDFKSGDVIMIEAFAGKDVYLDGDKNLFTTCYASDVVAKIKN